MVPRMSLNSGNQNEEQKKVRVEDSQRVSVAQSLVGSNARGSDFVAAINQASDRERRLIRRREENDLHTRVESILRWEQDPQVLVQRVVEQLRETPSLGIETAQVQLSLEFNGWQSEAVARVDGHTEDTAVEISQLSIAVNSLSIPISVWGTQIGDIRLGFRSIDESWTQRWIRLLWSIGAQVGRAIENLKIQEEKNRELSGPSRVNALASRTDDSKTALFADLSCRLRTHLNTILGYSEFLVEDANAEAYESVSQDAQRIRFAGEQLVDIIDELLDLSKNRLEKPFVMLEDFDVRDLVREAIRAMESAASINSNAFVVNINDGVDQMYSDPSMIRQCLRNLISNACKFSSHSTIEVRLDAIVKGSEEWIRLSVIDQGIGIFESDLSKIFLPSEQSDRCKATDPFGSDGLGLSRTKFYCDLLGGNVFVKSQAGVGSTFSMEFPRTLEPDSRAVSVVARAGYGRQSSAKSRAMEQSLYGPLTVDDLGQNEFGRSGRILAIDSNTDSLELIDRVFSRLGYEVIQATHSEAGLILVKSQRPDIILVDAMMPKINGWQFLSMLKADSTVSSTPVVLMAASENKAIGAALGASETVVKPVDWDLLKSIVARLIAKSRSRYILVVEDDPSASEILARTLRRAGWNVKAVENGREALEVVMESLPTLVIMDLIMPEISGFEFLHLMRSSPNTQTLPIIVFSNKTLSAEERLQLEGPAVKILHKISTQRIKLVELVRAVMDRQAF